MADSWNHVRVGRTAMALTAALSLWVVWTKSEYGFSAPRVEEAQQFIFGLILLGLLLIATVATASLLVSLLANGSPGTLSMLGAFYAGVVLALYGLVNGNPLLISGLTVGLLGASCMFPLKPAAKPRRTR